MEMTDMMLSNRHHCAQSLVFDAAAACMHAEMLVSGAGCFRQTWKVGHNQQQQESEALQEC